MRRTPLHVARITEDDAHEVEVISSYDNAYGFIEVAVDLWRLAGRADRAQAIDDVITGAYVHDPPRLDATALSELRRLLEGLEGSLVGTVTDENHLLSMPMVSSLRGRTACLDLDEARGELAREAVIEALVYVSHLRTIIDEALQCNANILFD